MDSSDGLQGKTPTSSIPLQQISPTYTTVTMMCTNMSTRCLISILAASFLSSDINNILGTGTGNPSSIFAAAAANEKDIDDDDDYALSSDINVSTAAEAEVVATGGSDKCLFQSDFDHGTHIISESGMYKLCEDITFAPNKPNLDTATDEEIANAFDPVIQDEYNINEYSLGFFAALVVAAPDVTLHLNGYTIQQDASHALLQRFFAVIELASAPFISGAGPAQFVSDALVSATNFKLQGPGVIGRSSHHGIHGNNNVDVVINNVVFRDFEVAAVSLNNVKGLDIVNCNIPHNRQGEYTSRC